MGAAKISVRCVHELKTWPPFYQAILDGTKTFELRSDDRGFQVGDALHLREYDNNRAVYSGRWVRRLVTYKLSGGQFAGIERGFCILGLGQVLPDAEGREYPLVPPSNLPVRRALDIAESANASDNSAITQCEHTPNTVVSIECPKCKKVFDRTVVYRTAQ